MDLLVEIFSRGIDRESGPKPASTTFVLDSKKCCVFTAIAELDYLPLYSPCWCADRCPLKIKRTPPRQTEAIAATYTPSPGTSSRGQIRPNVIPTTVPSWSQILPGLRALPLDSAFSLLIPFLRSCAPKLMAFKSWTAAACETISSASTYRRIS